jgi:hypothetical protein
MSCNAAEAAAPAAPANVADNGAAATAGPVAFTVTLMPLTAGFCYGGKRGGGQPGLPLQKKGCDREPSGACSWPCFVFFVSLW